jgi:hypothetical protein
MLKANWKFFHSQPKLFWYLLSSIAEDEETQKKGMVFISYSLDSKLESNEENDHVWWACILCAQSLPVRFSSFHYCYNTPTIGSNMKLFISAGNPFTRARMRMHQGKEMIMVSFFISLFIYLNFSRFYFL